MFEKVSRSLKYDSKKKIGPHLYLWTPAGLALYPRSLPAWGRKGQPGTHCMRMCKKSPEFGIYVFFRLRMTHSDESAVCAQRMAVAVCLSQSFVEDVAYALSQLRMQHLKFKEEQQRAIEAVCHGDDVFVSLPTGFGKSRCFHVHPFLYVRKLGCMDG